MKIRFSVTSFVSTTTRLGVVGSLPELGAWKPQECVPLVPLHVNKDELEPSMWSYVVEINQDDVAKDLVFKFIRWTTDEALNPSTEIKFGSAFCQADPMKGFIPSPPQDTETVTWEGAGSAENRILTFDKARDLSPPGPTALVHTYSQDDILDGIYTLPVYQFREPFTDVSEACHTTRSYIRLKTNMIMHYNRVLEKVVIGTCPRKPEHILHLKEKEAVSDIINLQAEEDIPSNFPDPSVPFDQRTSSRIYEIYDAAKLRYVWIPMTDMSSESRARGVAQAAFLMAGLAMRKDCTGIYVHCNAGVGRSVACVAGLMHCVYGISLRLTNLIINSRRPVAYFDEAALKRAAVDFDFKFGEAAIALCSRPDQ